jgi:hypothetical protein
MSFVMFTRPDDSPVAINPDEVVHLAPVPTDGPLMGPLTKGTRIVFRNQSHQDVKELLDVVVARINASRSGALAATREAAAAMRRALPPARAAVAPTRGAVSKPRKKARGKRRA